MELGASQQPRSQCLFPYFQEEEKRRWERDGHIRVKKTTTARSVTFIKIQILRRGVYITCEQVSCRSLPVSCQIFIRHIKRMFALVSGCVTEEK